MTSAPGQAARVDTFASSRSRPFDVLVARLDGVTGHHPKIRARCPAHGGAGDLSVSESSDGVVVVKCFAGCTVSEIVHAVGLEMRDLFPARTSTQRRDRDESDLRERQAFQRDPDAYLRGALRREIAHVQAERKRDVGFAPPLRSAEVDRARRRVATLVGIPLSAVPAAIGWPLCNGCTTRPAVWEWPPHDTDPRWPAIFDVALGFELEELRIIDPTIEIDVEADDLWAAVPYTLERAALRAAESLARVGACGSAAPA